MATVRVFEDLRIWQMASVQCEKIFELIEDGRFDFDEPLANQINRSSGSVMDTIAEGFDRFTKADFRHFLVIARGSNAEVRSQLYRAKARNHISTEEASNLIAEARRLGISINSFIQHIDRSGFKSKPKENAGSVEEDDVEYFIPDDLSYDFPEKFLNPQ